MSETSTGIRVEHGGDLVSVVMDRPERRNMLTLPLISALASHLRAIPAETKVVHLHGAGADFCLGRDPQGNPVATSAAQIRAALIEPILDLYDALSACPVPVVASVRGVARGFGAALAVACDVTIASDTARFSLPEMERDLPPTLAISTTMRKVLPKALTHLVYSMDEIDAVSALSVGLVGSVVPDSSLEVETDRLLATMRARSRSALVAVKEYGRAAPELGPRAARDYAATLLATVLSSAAR